ERMRAAVADLARLHFNTLYPVVWNGGYAWYPSEVTQRRGLQSFTPRGLQGQDPLSELVAEAHARGLLVVPWFEFGFMATPGMEIATRHPEWLTRARDGSLTSVSAAGEVAWLNPFRPEVQQLISELVVEIVEKSGADGIQFDDHMSLPSQFGYDPFTTALYQRETRRPVPADPQDPGWVKWRADKITAFMARLHADVNAKHPGALFSVSPNYHDFAYKLQLQNWREWVRRGIVDELLVQLYRPDMESFRAELERPELAESLKRIPVAIGVMAGQRNRPVPIALVSAQAEAARARGLGAAFFYFETLWLRSGEPPELRQQVLADLFAAPAPRPLTRPTPS
ncbi:MAG: family 10 glycosylhydrolase, partial [Cyanobium sp.]